MHTLVRKTKVLQTFGKAQNVIYFHLVCVRHTVTILAKKDVVEQFDCCSRFINFFVAHHRFSKCLCNLLQLTQSQSTRPKMIPVMVSLLVEVATQLLLSLDLLLHSLLQFGVTSWQVSWLHL